MAHTNPRKTNVSITVLLTTAVGSLVALTVSVVIALSFYTNFTNTTELLEQSSDQLIKRIEQYIVSHIDPARFVVNHITRQAANGSLDLSDKSELIPTLRASLAAAPELTGVAYWRPNGHETQVRRQNDGTLAIISDANKNDQQLKDFLASIRLAKSPVWTGPLRLHGLSFVSVSSPIFRDGEFLGNVSTGISIGNLSLAIKEAVEGTVFTGFILYDESFVLAHKNLTGLSKAKLSQNAPLHNLNDIDDAVLARYPSGKEAELLKSKNFEVRSVLVGDIRHVVISREVSFYGLKKWRVGVHVPQSQVNTQIQRVLVSLLAGIGFLIASVIATIFLARQIAKPIKSLSLAADQISKLELGQIPQLPSSRITEINNQSMAFNQMLDGLKWFEAYVPRKLVRRLIKEHGEDAVASRQEELTVMFTDLIGFTKMSENLSPSEVGKLLNEHFEVVYSCINKTDGTLDKYIGDAVMAFWGAPETQHDHAMRACEAAMRIAETLADVDTDLRMKIALHTGPLIVGNIGAQGRMNYTVIGDTVNTCARIEKLAGDLDDGSKVFILLSDQVAQAVKGKFKTEPAGEFSVKGRNAKVIVHRLVSRL